MSIPSTRLQTVTGLQIQPVLASPREIARLIKTHFGVGGETVTALVQERANDGVELLEGFEADDSELAKMAQEASVVKLVNEILIEAANERASDIHIEPGRKQPAHPLPHRRHAANPEAAAGNQPLPSRRSSAASRSWRI